MADDPDSDIVVFGRRREVNRSRITGQSITINPVDASRFDSLTHLKRESSVLAPETGRISPSGFVVPKIRGQDVKLTDVYLEDMLLQDPYSGLPLIEDLDLRAFGSLEIHQGLPPPDVPGLNPIGTLRYRFRSLTENLVTAGLQTGRPYGLSHWALGKYYSEKGQEETSAQIYVRHHQTNGRFEYYSDEGTPYNKSDDAMKIRHNNDQRSAQAVPFFRQKIGSYTFQGIGWRYQAFRGLPSMSAVVVSDARETAEGHLANLNISRELDPIDMFEKIRFGLNLTDTADHRQVTDPGRRFLLSAEQSDMQINARRGSLNMAMEGEDAGFFASYENGTAIIRNELGERRTTDLNRRAETGTMGVRMSPLPSLSIECKATERHHTDITSGNADTVNLPDEQNPTRRNNKSNATGGSIGFHPGAWGIYLQQAAAKRLPSLIEEFGNGSSIRPNTDLNPELTHHKEIGFSYRDPTMAWRIGLAAYEDETWNKIIFVPVMASAVRAANIRATDIQGVDAHGEVSADATTLFISASRLYPYDKTRSNQIILPGIPEKIFVGEIMQKIGQVTLRWISRYRSMVYRDLSNTVQLPGAWIHDLSADYDISVGGHKLQAGLSLRNVFDLTDVTISAPDTPENRGRTAYSDVAGAPLPGRQWLLSLVDTI
jgi:hypothetical protein